MPTPRVTIDGLPEQTTIETDNYVIVQDTGTTKKMLVSKILDATPTQLTAHINQATDAHDASAVSAVPTGAGVDADTVQGQLGQLASLITAADSAADAVQVALDAHITDADDAHDATAISAVSSGTGVDGATVQAQLGQLKGLIDQVNTVLGTLAATYVDIGGDTMTGPLTLPATDPPTDDAAARKAYVDSRVATKLDQAQADGLYVDVDGDTMTGPLTLPADPSAALQASTKQYVDNQDLAYQLQYIDDFVFKAGDTMTGPLTLPANPTTALQAATKQYVDTQVGTALDQTEADARYVNVAGDTLTGALTLAADPTAALQPATKQYVDAATATAAIRPHLYLPGTTGHFVSAPDPAQLAGATQLDIRWIEKAPPNGVAGYAATPILHQATNASVYSFRIAGLAGQDAVILMVNSNPAYVGRSVRPVSGVTAARFTWRASDGRVQAFTKPTSNVAAMLDNTGWTQVGADGTLAAAPLINDPTPLTFGAYASGSSPGTINMLAISVATTIDGAPFALWRSDPMDQLYTDDYGVAWTINGTGWEWRDANGLQIGGFRPLYLDVARWRTSYWYGAPVFSVATQVPQESLITANMLLIPDGLALNAIGVEIVTPGSTGALLRLGVYKQNPTGNTGVTLMQDAGTIDGTQAAGGYELPLTIPAQPSPWWAMLCCCVQGVATTRPTLRIGSMIQQPPMGRASTALASALGSIAFGGYLGAATGAFPASIATVPTELTNAPRVMVRGTQT